MSTEAMISMFHNALTSLKRRDPCFEKHTSSRSGSSLIPLFRSININSDNNNNNSDQQNTNTEVFCVNVDSYGGTTLTEWRILNQQYAVSYKGLKVPKPIKTFSDCSLSPELLTALANTSPSPIDMATIPLALHQRDVLCSGVSDVASKGRVFLLPLLIRILSLPRMPPRPRNRNTKAGGGPYAVILAPDRDLGEALRSLIIWFYPILRISVFDLYGPEVDMIDGFPVVVATPFRLYDCLYRRLVTLDQCSFVALYQVDQILDTDNGRFYLDYIIKAMPTHYPKPNLLDNDEEFIHGEVFQTAYMICSTITPFVQRLADDFLRSPVEINLVQRLADN